MLGMAEKKVKKMGFERAQRVAYAVACRSGRPVLVPIPGTGRSQVVRPKTKSKTKSKTMSLAIVPKKRALVLQAQVRGNMPEGGVKPGNRGPVPPGVLRALSAKKARAERAENQAVQAADARAAFQASHSMSQKALGPGGKLSLPPMARGALAQGQRLSAGRGVQTGPVVQAAVQQQKLQARGGPWLRWLGGKASTDPYFAPRLVGKL